MLKTLRLITIAAAASLVLPAVAGPSWPPTPPAKAAAKSAPAAARSAPAAAKVVTAPDKRVLNGFEYVGGEAGWQLAQHKYDFVQGRLVMSDECDHAIRQVQRPTLEELERARQLYGGGA